MKLPDKEKVYEIVRDCRHGAKRKLTRPSIVALATPCLLACSPCDDAPWRQPR